VSTRARFALIGAAIVAAACAPAVPGSTTGFEGVSIEDARDLPASFASREGRPGPNGGTVYDPISEPIDDGVAYRFDLGHCGLYSPVDLDGSFWDAIGGTASTGETLDLDTDGEMINATSGAIVVIGDEMRFRTASGSVVRFERHPGEKELPGCD
jgi:hypothetical protein